MASLALDTAKLALLAMHDTEGLIRLLRNYKYQECIMVVHVTYLCQEVCPL
jgi:hypothetical protein